MVSIIVIQTRQGKYFDEAMKSLSEQIYKNTEIILIENLDFGKTIGKAWNEGVRKAKGEYCFFFGDDDLLSEDYLLSVVALMENNLDNGIIGITTMLTAFRDDSNEVARFNRYPTGMFKTSYLLENPFDETLQNKVDTEYHSRLGSKGHKVAIANWHFGYFYRQHDGQVSTRKLGI